MYDGVTPTEETVKQMGKLSIWVNNAGGADDRTMRNLIDVPEYQWDFQNDLNLKAVWAGSIEAAKRMEEGSSIINVSSIEAFNPSPTNGPYAAAKAGVHALTKTLSKEYGRRGITSNVVVPGFFDTDMTRETMPDIAKQYWKQNCPVPKGRMGEISELAKTVAFLASEGAAFIKGS